MIGILDESAALVEERIVDAPRIDADAVEPRGPRRVQAPPHLGPEAIDVPPQRSTLADRPIREAMDLLDVEHAA